MDSSDFTALIGRLERYADDHPKLYSAKVVGIAALGYLPVALAAAATLTAALACVSSLAGERVQGWALLALAIGLLGLIALVRALRVSMPAPEGRAITREEAPQLFAVIDDVLQRTRLGRGATQRAVSLSRVTLDQECGIGLRQIPRWGVFGRYTNHLQLGIPLLAVLSSAELKAVLAHEVGHLCSEHGKFVTWIYRQRRTWQALQRKLESSEHAFERLLASFYDRYVPYFDAYTFVLARNHEYQADQLAAWATDARVLARALVKIELASRFIGEVFWERFYAQLERSREPPYLPYSMMPRALSVAHKEWLRADWLQASLHRFSAEADTHPSLGERLAALDVAPQLPTHTRDGAALALLGLFGRSLLKSYDEEWRAAHADAWRKRHDELKEARWKISQYQNTPEEELKLEDRWEKSLLLLDVGQVHAAVEELRVLIILDPQAAKAQFLLGRLLLESGDEAGLHNLATAAQCDQELLGPAGQLGYGYLIERGRKAEAQRFWERCQAA